MSIAVNGLTMDIKKRKCSACFFFERLGRHHENGSGPLGYCRRKAPATSTDGNWPKVLTTDWCGEGEVSP